MAGHPRCRWRGPEHHSVELEDRVRVLDAPVEAGDTAPLHTHRWPGVQYLLRVADFVRRDGNVSRTTAYEEQVCAK
jgi:hypothetical protein